MGEVGSKGPQWSSSFEHVIGGKTIVRLEGRRQSQRMENEWKYIFHAA